MTDLLTATLSAADRRAAPPPETVHTALRAAVLDFVQRNLGDHRLSASSVAAAHHVSTRTLNRVFESHGDTISAFIKRCRFERCMRDLADPALRHQAIQDITTRWCFRSQTHFNRRFRETTGMTPGEYRSAARAGTGHVGVIGHGVTRDGMSAAAPRCQHGDAFTECHRFTGGSAP